MPDERDTARGPRRTGAAVDDGSGEAASVEPAGVPERRRGEGAPAAPRQPVSTLRKHRKTPILRVLGYYALLVAVAAALIETVPAARAAFLAPIAAPAADQAERLLGGGRPPAAEAATPPLEGLGELTRMTITALGMVGALLLVLPIAGIYMFTRRLRYDPSLVHSLIILPLVITAIVMVVKSSLALAFSLAGIVAAVRFRNTLKDPKDAVYIFLAIGIGLASGVQALDVALVMSLTFNLVVLVLWRYDLGAIYSSGADDSLIAIGDANLLISRRARDRAQLRERVQPLHEDISADGILVVHATDGDRARRSIEIALSRNAKKYRVGEPYRRAAGLSTIEALVELGKKQDPIQILGELEERWSAQIAAAEWVPYLSSDADEDDE
ncbi:MAG: DUF4956 domain-containing protein [Longimicrobiales bacterium]